MKVSVSKWKNQTIYYLSKSVWVDGKSTTKTIEKIGSEDELLKVCGELSPLEWAKQYAAKRSSEEKASKKDIILKYSSSTLIKKVSCRSVNVGYLFLKDIYYDLKIHIVSQREIKKILTTTRK
nr:hypothetical protein [Oribacterium sinus]